MKLPFGHFFADKHSACPRGRLILGDSFDSLLALRDEGSHAIHSRRAVEMPFSSFVIVLETVHRRILFGIDFGQHLH